MIEQTRRALREVRSEIEEQNKALFFFPELRESGERVVAQLDNLIGPERLVRTAFHVKA